MPAQTEARKRFTSPKARMVAAFLLPVLLATVVSQAITLLWMPGVDGFYFSVAVLWPGLWLAAFFHCFFAQTALRVWVIQTAITLLGLVPFFIPGHA